MLKDILKGVPRNAHSLNESVFPISPKGDTGWGRDKYKEEDHVSMTRLFSFANIRSLLFFVEEAIKLSHKYEHDIPMLIDDKTVLVYVRTPDGIDSITEIDLFLANELDELFDDSSYLGRDTHL